VGLYFRGAADRGYGRHESVTPSGDRDDEAVLAQLLAEGAAQGRNILSEVVLFDDGAGPDRAQQLVLGHRLSGVQDQMHERFDRLRHQLHGRAVRIDELAPDHVQAVAMELTDLGCRGAQRGALMNPQKASAILIAFPCSCHSAGRDQHFLT
jgi:hypothetical protein